jgi:hypothetical protein
VRPREKKKIAGIAVIFKVKDISQCNSVWRPKEMSDKWEGEWKNERIYLEIDTPPITESFFKAFLSGLFGPAGQPLLAKSKCLLKYGNQIVDSCEIAEVLDSVNEMYGRGIQPDGQEAYFYVQITQTMTGIECELEINNEKVRIHPIT